MSPDHLSLDHLSLNHMTAAASTHLVIADDHPLFRDALRQAVSSVVISARIDGHIVRAGLNYHFGPGRSSAVVGRY